MQVLILPQSLLHQRTMTKFGKWAGIGGIVAGANHIRQDTKCQDAVLIKEDKDYIVAAVADGHGSSRCKYSLMGSNLAVKIACEFLGGLMESGKDIFLTQKDIWIPKKIETAWKNAVFSDYNTNNYELYGTTLLAVLVSYDFIFVLQIGDGDIIAISNDNAYFIFNDIIKIGEDTESLCMEESWKYIKTAFISPDNIDMIMLSSDGYSNSFITESDFFQAGMDFYKLWNDKAYLQKNLPDWLYKTSQKGSGDDITVALIGKS